MRDHNAMSAVTAIAISPVERLALMKLALICKAVADGLGDAGARKEMLALTSVLVDVAGRKP